jgi:hypothetical protein
VETEEAKHRQRAMGGAVCTEYSGKLRNKIVVSRNFLQAVNYYPCSVYFTEHAAVGFSRLPRKLLKM